MTVTLEQWKRMLSELRYKQALSNLDLYVEPGHAAASKINASFRRDLDGSRKFLLIGSRGGGKSTELRRLAQLLDDFYAVATVDLDAAGLTASELGAFDLLYVTGLAALKLVRDQAKAEELWKLLGTAYAGEERKSALGSLADALGGVATFGGAVGAAATIVGLTATGATGIGAAAGAMAAAIRLFKPGRVVSPNVAEGLSLLAACEAIRAQISLERGRRTCVLVDGLERMNGESENRFRRMFSDTRLLERPGWSAVIAAPPATITTTVTATVLGFETQHVWGFGLDGGPFIRRLLAKRFADVGLEMEAIAEPGAVDLLIRNCGGLPRDAVKLAYFAVSDAIEHGAAQLGIAQAQAGVDQVASDLEMGLGDEDLRLLLTMFEEKPLPQEDERAARLYSDGRIIAIPRTRSAPGNRFIIHPALEPVVKWFAEEEKQKARSL